LNLLIFVNSADYVEIQTYKQNFYIKTAT